MLGGLVLFGVVFALNSSVHSYLVLAYSEADRVSLSVGFYYMANACGRLLGTLDGLLHCLRYDVLDWTWGSNASTKRQPTHPTPAARAPRQRQSPTATRATAVL